MCQPNLLYPAVDPEGDEEAVGEEVDVGDTSVRPFLAQEGDAGDAQTLTLKTLQKQVGLAPPAPGGLCWQSLVDGQKLYILGRKAKTQNGYQP